MRQPWQRIGVTGLFLFPDNLYLISINDCRKCIFKDFNFTAEEKLKHLIWCDLVTFTSEKMGHLYYLFLILHIVFLSSEILNITGPVRLAILYHIAAEKSYK